MSLHDLLDDVARAAPSADALRYADDAWGKAGRRRRRTHLTAGAAVIGLLVVALVVGTSITRPAQEPLPGARLDPGQGIPAQIYSVEPWLETIGSDPVPPIAYVVEEAYLERPVAISVDGSYRYLPGPPGDEGYTLTSYAVSHDGRHVALAWSGIGNRWTGQPVHAQVFAYDVTTGQRTGPWLGRGFAGEITDLTWRPDGEGFAWQETRQVGAEVDTATETVAVVAMHWDHDSQDLVGAEGPLAWSPDGTELLVSLLDGPNPRIVNIRTGASRPLDVPPGTVFGSGAWSPDGSRIAGLAVRTSEVDLVVADAVTGIGEGSPPLGEDIGQTVLGWRDGNPVFLDFGQPDLRVEGVDAETLQPVSPPLTTGLGHRTDERLTAALALLDSAPVVTTPPPSQSRLSWTYLGTIRVELSLLGLAALAMATLLVVAIVRRRSRTSGRQNALY